MRLVRAIGEELRLERQARVSAVRRWQTVAIIDLEPWRIAPNCARKPLIRADQPGDGAEVPGGFAQHEIDIVRMIRPLPDSAQRAEIEGRFGHLADFPRWDQVGIDGRVEIGGDF